MDVLKYITVLVVVFFGGGDAGGHGGSHDHLNLHVPEFIHHDHHTKIITIHHHHHKPEEKHHHHHHHHHHKPHIPYGHHYHKEHKKTHLKTTTTSTGHGHHGQGHKPHHGYHGHHGKYGHHGDSYQSHAPKHLDTPSFSYDPNPVTFEDNYKSFAPSVPAHIPQTPQVYGVEHTVKQVKVFDSLPGALPGNTGSHGYEVTEEGENSDDDTFTSVNSLSQAFPATFGFVRDAGIDTAQNELLADFGVQSSPQANHDPFVSAPQPTSFAHGETFSNGHADPFSSLAPNQEFSPSAPASQYPTNVGATGFDDPGNSYSGDITGTALVSSDDALNEDTPVSFSREAGIQETTNTGGVETFVY